MIQHASCQIDIDTSRLTETRVAMIFHGITRRRIIHRFGCHSQSVLLLLDELLKAGQITSDDITEIRVHTGPGSFTGLRVGTAIATMLGVLLGIGANQKKPGVLPLIIYG